MLVCLDCGIVLQSRLSSPSNAGQLNMMKHDVVHIYKASPGVHLLLSKMDSESVNISPRCHL